MSAMRLGMLYLRSRSAGRAGVFFVAIAAAAWLWLWLRWDSTSAITITSVPIVVPLAAAMVVGASAGSPFGESEATASRPLWPLRGGHLILLVAIAAVALALAVLRWSAHDSAWTLVRNLAGFTGLTLLAVRVLGSGLSWALPLGYAILSSLALRPGEQPSPWAWPALAATDRAAAVIAIGLLLAGLAAVALFSRPDRVGEEA